MGIYDCFMYFDEDLLLDLRLNIMNKYVKKFIITESTFLHSGREKKLNFDIKKFSKFKDKIEYIVIDNQPEGIEEFKENDKIEIKNKKILDNSLKRENNQRNMLIKGLNQAHDNDLIFSSDLDEIPNLKNFKFKDKITLFEQDVFYYKFNLIQPNFKWIGTRACKKKNLKSLQWLRNIKGRSYPFWRIDTFISTKKYMNIDIIKNGGWHFTSIKKPKDIHYKLSNFMHHLEYEYSGLNLDDMEKMVKEKKILYDHSAKQEEEKYKGGQSLEKVEMEKLPDFINMNLEKYKEWLD
jgi:beta-1,4-mannosyl-glycoprotein beta-1,4-N-acetylglucosaminyltransferase